ncbi:hypothetical protein Glove_505g46 [Diversispora epigaea]|uniref:Retrotransposon gag domain-containing protein n=1 Tax=Diversispora epigaea TaxID=1348612 RepID=A0A397GKN0_9GLOM|nr:hypothetical protein Glove_505g46 [Diversispora epigaea]
MKPLKPLLLCYPDFGLEGSHGQQFGGDFSFYLSIISCERIKQLNRTINEIIAIYNHKIEEIINYAEEQRNNGAPAIIDPREVQELRHIRAQINCLTRIRDNYLQILYDLEWLQDMDQQRNRTRLTVNIPRRRRPLYQNQQQPVRPSLNTLLPPRSPPLSAQIQRRNLSPEGSTFTQTRPSTRSNTSTSSDSPSRSISPIENTRRIQRDFLTGQYDSEFEVEYRPIINLPRNRNIEVEPEDQLLINFDGSDNNNNLEPEREEPNEEDQDIEAYNNENLQQFLQQIHEIEPEPQLIAERDMATFVVKPPKFSGTPNEDAQEWLQGFLVAAKANGWDDDRKRAVFGTYLKKEPREWYCEWVEDHNAHTWTELRTAFIETHCTDDWREQWHEELRSLKQRRGETVDEYFHQVRKLAKRVNLNAGCTLPYFIRGLLPDIKAIVKTHEPADLATAYGKAKAYEQGKSELKRRSKKTFKYKSSSAESSDSSDDKEEEGRRKRS